MRKGKPVTNLHARGLGLLGGAPVGPKPNGFKFSDRTAVIHFSSETLWILNGVIYAYPRVRP